MMEYLSDDEIGGRRRRARRRAAGKSVQLTARERAIKRAAKRAAKGKGATRRQRRKIKGQTVKEQRVAEGRPSRVARIGLAPARRAFRTVLSLNIGKAATKMVRVYQKAGGKKKLQEFWRKFGGKDWGKLMKSVNKGAKTRLSNDEIGAVTVAAAAAVAAPILIAFATLVKAFKAGGSEDEMSEYDEMVEMGKKELATNPEFAKGMAYMDNEDVAVMDRETQDFDSDGMPRMRMGSFFSLIGLLFKTVFMLALVPQDAGMLSMAVALLSTYCVIGIILLPFKLAEKSWIDWYYQPINFILYELTKQVKKLLRYGN